ncbi:MAG TPA: 50S ribosomal protein L13 [Elusimicrobiota bacterium]|nr:50S ribosomal protein L13 [Elusimicrobiota bacterium]
MLQTTTLTTPQAAAQDRRWHTLDMKGQILGRVATRAAVLLRGKHKKTYTDYVDCGDFVTIANAKHLVLSGNKMNTKFYFSHSGYAGGAKTTPVRRLMEKDPAEVVYRAVKRMLPDNRLRGAQLRRLRIFAEEPPRTSAAPSSAKKEAAKS